MDLTSIDSDFHRELMAVFVAEASDRLAAIDRAMLQLDTCADPDDRRSLLADVMRELHTLKGSTGAVNLGDVSALAHTLETLVGGIDASQPVDPTVVERLDDGLRVMQSVIEDRAAGGEGSDEVEDAIAAASWAPPDPNTAEVETHLRQPSALIPPSAPSERSAAVPIEETVRLATGKLDALMTRVGELVSARLSSQRTQEEIGRIHAEVARWEAQERHGGSLAADSGETQWSVRLRSLREALDRLQTRVDADERVMSEVTAGIEAEVRRTRMLPVATILDPIHRMVRELARELSREADLVVEGGDTEVDRSVLEQLRGPLAHLIRNAVDHGLESPNERELQGKPTRGIVRIAATERAGTLVMSVADDGAGMSPSAIGERAVARGVISDEVRRTLSERDLLRLVMRSGFSTRDQITDVSGRGVGLDAVREVIERLGGHVDIAAEPGMGTTFTLSVPLSVASTRCLLVGVGEERFAVPISAVSRIVAVGPGDVARAQGRAVISLPEGPVVVTSLDDLLQLPGEEDGDRRRSAVIVGDDARRFAVLVDEVHATHELVVKPLPAPLSRVRHAAGASILGDGSAVIVLNMADIVRSAVRAVVRPDGAAPVTATTHQARAGATVLVVDDSIVTRMLEKSILEAAGYTVRVAADGEEAWEIMHREQIDVVVSDVNMPVMDGLALTTKIRANGALGATPVVLVTSLDSPDDRTRGLHAGADAYIVKSMFSQDGLLDAVARLA